MDNCYSEKETKFIVKLYKAGVPVLDITDRHNKVFDKKRGYDSVRKHLVQKGYRSRDKETIREKTMFLFSKGVKPIDVPGIIKTTLNTVYRYHQEYKRGIIGGVK